MVVDRPSFSGYYADVCEIIRESSSSSKRERGTTIAVDTSDRWVDRQSNTISSLTLRWLWVDLVIAMLSFDEYLMSVHYNRRNATHVHFFLLLAVCGETAKHETVVVDIF